MKTSWMLTLMLAASPCWAQPKPQGPGDLDHRFDGTKVQKPAKAAVDAERTKQLEKVRSKMKGSKMIKKIPIVIGKCYVKPQISTPAQVIQDYIARSFKAQAVLAVRGAQAAVEANRVMTEAIVDGARASWEVTKDIVSAGVDGAKSAASLAAEYLLPW